MTAIYVCSLARLEETVERSGARHVVTLINSGTPVPRPASIEAENHLFVGINDICDPLEGMVCPEDSHVGEMLDFARRWNRAAPMVVHCFAGISRSTAGAFAAYCALRPDLDEAEIAWRLRQRSPAATPNARIVAIADRLLGREGRMQAAVAAIGRGGDAYEGQVFALDLNE